ncbi:MAG TPA: hypothetical protein VIO11_05295 [Candidatus Methanoperedens sp.]
MKLDEYSKEIFSKQMISDIAVNSIMVDLKAFEYDFESAIVVGSSTETIQVLKQDKISLMLKKIDNESETPELISNILYPQSEDKNTEKRLVFSLLQAAIRYACFLDKYHESGEAIYLEEAYKHRSIIFSSLTPEKCMTLESIEKKILPFWDYERCIQKRIEDDDSFSDADIREYIYLRSSDSLFYCEIANAFHPLNPETAELFHKRLMLFDIVDSIQDFEEDMRDKQPNILVMWLLNYMSRDMIPLSLPQALDISRKHKINSKIHDFGRELYQYALKSGLLNTIPLLEKDFDVKYHTLKELLR